jgi:hypothetical protein
LAEVLTLPSVPTRSLDAYKINTGTGTGTGEDEGEDDQPW